MNAGAMGEEIGKFVHSVTMVNRVGEINQREVKHNEFKYRQWVGGKDGVVAIGHFCLKQDRSKNIQQICQNTVNQRKAKQPQAPSAGSIFKNPPGDYAGRLIEAVGLKGVVVGGAMISLRHANFIVNNGGATSADVMELMELMKKKVKRETGVRLEPEVKMFGDQ